MTRRSHIGIASTRGQTTGDIIGVVTSFGDTTEALRNTFETFITLPNRISLTMVVRDSVIIGDYEALISRTTRFDMVRDTYFTYFSRVLDDRHPMGDYMLRECPHWVLL